MTALFNVKPGYEKSKHQYEAFSNYRMIDFRWHMGAPFLPVDAKVIYASGSNVGRRQDGFVVVKLADGSLVYGVKDAWYEHNWEPVPTTIDDLITLLKQVVRYRKHATLYWWRDKFQEFLDEQRTGTEERTGVPQRTDEAVT